MKLGMTFDEMMTAVKGTSVARPGQPSLPIDAINTDTRSIKPGELFFAIKGKTMDGHDFAAQAASNGACAAVVNADKADSLKDIPCPVIAVKDTVLALGDLARFHRSRLYVTAVAVTGSNGKTTTKDMIFHLLSKDRGVVRSIKSFNNNIGVPLTMLDIEPKHDHAVFELGTNGFGEIAYLAGIVQPSIGVITNVSETHLEGLNSIEGVAKAKAELLEYIDPEGFAILNADNEWTNRMAMDTKRTNSVTFGLYNNSNIKGSEVESRPDGVSFIVNDSVKFDVPVMGPWNVYNALAAISVCYTLGYSFAELASRFRDFKLPPMRMEKTPINGVIFINDAYNANPRSMQLATDEFSVMESKGRKVLVLGDMLELGERSDAHHDKIIAKAAGMELASFVCVGREMSAAMGRFEEKGSFGAHTDARTFPNSTEAAEFLAGFLKQDDVVMLKGSRGTALERIIDRFSKSAPADGGAGRP